jgi:tripartite-type tricarboxylate transporter receptor subunit TctC
MRIALQALVCSVAVVFSTLAAAQDFPNHPIRLIVPYAPGGTSDFTARLVAQKMTENMKQSVIVDNRGGAAGTIGADLVAKSAPDGYTIMLTDTTFAIVPGIKSNLPYDPVKDFAPITLGITVPSVVCVYPGLPVKTLKDLLALAKEKPGSIAFGSGGVGTAVHLAGEFLKTVAHIDIIHVPYKGAGPAIADVMAGQLQMVIPSMPTVVPFIQAGKLRALAITAAKRSPLLPDVPTVAEAGLPQYEATSWFGFSAPAGTPKPVMVRLQAEMARALADKDTRERFMNQGADVVGGSSEQFSRFINSEMKKWADVAHAAHVTAEF